MDAHETAFVSCPGVGKISGTGFGRDNGRAFDVIDLPGESEEVEDTEDGHFYAKEEGGYADSDIWGLDVFGGFNGARGSEEGDDYLVMTVREYLRTMVEAYILPEREENNKFYGNDLEAWSLFHKISPKLEEELEEAEHRDSHAHAFDSHYLNRLAL